MRKWWKAALLCCMVLPLTACGFHGMSSWKWLEVVDDLAGALGAAQITADEELLGERIRHDDGYVGSYTAQCQDSTGKDVVFGGASIEPRRIQVYGQILTDRGRAAVRIRMNAAVMVLETDGEGRFEAEIHLGSGGNYIMVDYEDFSGTVRLNSIRLPLDWDGKDALAFNR